MSHEKGIEAAQVSLGLCCKDDMVLAIKAYLDASGMVMVPREPTEEMRIAWNCAEGNGTSHFGNRYYFDMISVAPNPFERKQDE